MNCKDFRQNVTRYIDMELQSNLEGEFKEHLEKCEECMKEYIRLEDLHSKLAQLFTEKDVPMGFETRIISSLPEHKRRFNIKEVFVMKKALTFLIPILLITVGLTVVYKYTNGSFRGTSKMTTKYDMPAIVRVSNTKYDMFPSEVITDERVIDKEIGVIKIKLDGGSKLQDNSPWASTIAEPGTKVYCIKGLDEKEAIALKINGEWKIFRVRTAFMGVYPVFTDDMLKAEKIVVRDINTEKNEVKEITNKETINKIALYIKSTEKVSEMPNYFQGGMRYEYYFLVRDSNGIGKITYRYFISMQDINFNGYINTRQNDSYYKTSADFNKLITSPFGSIPSAYDEKLGGKQQMYEAFLSSYKLIFRKLIKEGPSTKTDIIVLNQGENIWQNGSQIKDKLKGKYKVQIIMKDTTVQKNVMVKAFTDITKVPGAITINFTEGMTKDTLVIYICFDTKPEYVICDSEDSFVIELKQ